VRRDTDSSTISKADASARTPGGGGDETSPPYTLTTPETSTVARCAAPLASEHTLHIADSLNGIVHSMPRDQRMFPVACHQVHGMFMQSLE
jgi:hypothetical protein